VRVQTDNIELLVRNVKEYAKQYWRDLSDKTKEELEKRSKNLIDENIWNAQINDILEIYAAWVPAPSDSNGKTYPKQRRRLMELLSARKHTRDFRPGQGFAGVPKSLLDGARESVLQWNSHTEKILIKQGIRPGEPLDADKPGEPLDATGLIKRIAVGERSYPSVARIAADPWLRQLDDSDRQALCRSAEKIPKDVISRINIETYKQFKDFRYDGTLLYKDRHPTILKDAGRSENDQTLESLREELSELTKKPGIPDPSPYLAILCADGDRIGDALNRIDTLEKHQQFSRRLSTFAEEAREIVQTHQGVAVYTGGDDVLAFVPIDHCLTCARALHDAFSQFLADFSDEAGNPPTLSVGIAIGHFMEPLEELRRFGKEAERKAKGEERNGLAVVLHPRGGGTLHYRASWMTAPDQRIQTWVRAFQEGELPTGLPHDLDQLLALYAHFEEPLVKDVQRLLRVKGIEHPALATRIEQVSPRCAMQQLAKELLLASRLAAYLPPLQETK
jgi:CRISPR-associated protein Cmr2